MKVSRKGTNTYIILAMLASSALGAMAGALRPAEAAPQAGDSERNGRCARDFCSSFNKPSGQGEFACEAARSWTEAEIADSSFGKRLHWSPGDIRCEMKFTLDRAGLAKAAAGKEHTVRLGKRPMVCEVGSGKDKYAVKMMIAPEATFKEGKVDAVAVNASDFEAPVTIRAVLWTAAKLQSYFRPELVERLNKCIEEDCGARTHKAGK
jgi:hypothetical protein